MHFQEHKCSMYIRSSENSVNHMQIPVARSFSVTYAFPRTQVFHVYIRSSENSVNHMQIPITRSFPPTYAFPRTQCALRRHTKYIYYLSRLLSRLVFQYVSRPSLYGSNLRRLKLLFARSRLDALYVL
jgi:membrane-bound lytic murein transglycosylase